MPHPNLLVPNPAYLELVLSRTIAVSSVVGSSRIRVVLKSSNPQLLFLPFEINNQRPKVKAVFVNQDVEGASLWFDGKQQWMDGDWKVGQVKNKTIYFHPCVHFAFILYTSKHTQCDTSVIHVMDDPRFPTTHFVIPWKTPDLHDLLCETVENPRASSDLLYNHTLELGQKMRYSARPGRPDGSVVTCAALTLRTWVRVPVKSNDRSRIFLTVIAVNGKTTVISHVAGIERH